MQALLQRIWHEEDGLQAIEIVVMLIAMLCVLVFLRDSARGWIGGLDKLVSDNFYNYFDNFVSKFTIK
jgi:Flp pilus assembly pilin Flp